jgi:putative flippase GtrA
LGLHRIPAQAIILAASTVLSYFGHRHFSFRRSAADTQGKSTRT